MNPILQRLLGDVPLVTESVLLSWLTPSQAFDRAFEELTRASAGDVQAAEAPFFRWLRDQMRPAVERTRDGLAVIPVHGVLAMAPSVVEMYFFGMEDSRAVQRAIEDAAADPDVSGILLDVNSPGGMVVGGFDVADAVATARKQKPVVARTGGTMASLAYLIAAQADEIVASRMSAVGSIGVISTVLDVSGLYASQGVKVEIFTNKEGTFKGTGAPGTTLNDAQREYLQSRVDAAFAEFRGTVKSRRPDVPDSALRGQVFWGGEARRAGLVDRLGDMAFATSALRRRVRTVDAAR